LTQACEFCERPGGEVLWQNELCRVVRAEEAGYPAFCRVILARHAREMTDLAPAERSSLMAVVFAVEEAVRETVRPDKVNLASLGNAVPHVHWHVVARFADDPHFPSPVWCEPRRAPSVSPTREAAAARLPAAVRERLERLFP
jgi:diadenosine tetraphosphate (Ap4A) HIT family hydrolase